MGSRKKKQTPARHAAHFKAWWATLDVHQKMAFKMFWWHWGNMRIPFRDFFTTPSIIGHHGCRGANMPDYWTETIRLGYTWYHHAHRSKRIHRKYLENLRRKKNYPYCY